MNDKEVLRQFCQKHSIKILDTNKRASRYHKINLQYFTNPEDYNWIKEELVRDTEPLYTVEIAESDLERIATFESQVFNNLKQNGHFNMFEMLMKQKEHEKILKEKYPAVKKAYEQYSLMLKMAESGEL
jgi:hypothetical protein